MTKIRTICVDTLTALQEESYMVDKKKPNHDKWKDYGSEIYSFIINLQKYGFEIALILGEPGTGKSSGMRTLPSKTNMWFNADNKNPVWKGGKEEYGKKTSPKSPYHIIPKSYSEILNFIKQGIDKGAFEEDRYAILTGHVETFKTGLDIKERLKTIGLVATKHQLEGKMETVLYSAVETSMGKPNEYVLYTQNSGLNTARSHQEMFPEKIENDYNLIIESLLKY